jgi:hypothetical protein
VGEVSEGVITTVLPLRGPSAAHPQPTHKKEGLTNSKHKMSSFDQR